MSDFSLSKTAFAPATVANVGSGFDIMGFAINGSGDNVRVTFSPDTDNSLVKMTGAYAQLIPAERAKNTSSVAADFLFIACSKKPSDYLIELEKNMPLGSGMGSSAASAAAAVFAANSLLGSPFSTLQLIPFAMEGERVACGAAHADNVGPSLLGGFVLIRSYSPLDIVALPFPADLYAVVVHPHIELKTSDSRKVLPREVSMHNAITQAGNAAGLIAGLWQKDYELIGRSISDVLAEPYRTQLIPGFDAFKKAALEAGAIACGISGSGPSVFALCKGEILAKEIAANIHTVFMNQGLISDVFISGMNAEGTRLV